MATLASTANNTIDKASDKAKSAVNSGMNQVNSSLSQIDTESIRETVADYRDQAVEAYKVSEKYMRQNPFYFIGGAAAVGLVAGLLLGRRK